MPDQRTTAWKNYEANNISRSTINNQSEIITPKIASSMISTSVYNKPEVFISHRPDPVQSTYTGKVTKSGAPDMRTSEAKAWAASNTSSYSYSAGSSNTVSTSSYTSSAITSSGNTGGGGSSLSGYTGRLTAAGLPDMRTTAGKAWAAANK